MNIEDDILKNCIANNRKAQFTLYKKCYGLMLSICLRYERNKEDAEFMLNQGFMKVLTKLDQYSQDKPFEAWLRRIMINTIIDNYRKTNKENSIIKFKDIASDGTDRNWVDYNLADMQFEAEELRAMISTLPPESLKVFNLYTVEGYAHKEIAEMLGISDGTSKWHLSFARKKLRELIALSIEREATRVKYFEQGQ